VECQENRPDPQPVLKDSLISLWQLAKKVLRWEPRISLEEGLKKTIYYFRDLIKKEKRI